MSERGKILRSRGPTFAKKARSSATAMQKKWDDSRLCQNKATGCIRNLMRIFQPGIVAQRSRETYRKSRGTGFEMCPIEYSIHDAAQVWATRGFQVIWLITRRFLRWSPHKIFVFFLLKSRLGIAEHAILFDFKDWMKQPNLRAILRRCHDEYCVSVSPTYFTLFS